jgi:hypothetical protein
MWIIPCLENAYPSLGNIHCCIDSYLVGGIFLYGMNTIWLPYHIFEGVGTMAKKVSVGPGKKRCECGEILGVRQGTCPKCQHVFVAAVKRQQEGYIG